MNKKIEMLESIIKNLIQVSTPADFASALHNAFVHGEVFEEVGIEFTDEQLSRIFDGLDIIVKTCKELEAY